MYLSVALSAITAVSLPATIAARRDGLDNYWAHPIAFVVPAAIFAALQQRVNHPFVRAVCAGTATLDQIRAWALQDYQFRRAVPRVAMLSFSNFGSVRAPETE